MILKHKMFQFYPKNRHSGKVDGFIRYGQLFYMTDLTMLMIYDQTRMSYFAVSSRSAK